MATVATSWTPPSDVRSHLGSLLSSNLDFFASPPAEIGKLLTAYSTLKKDDSPLSLPVQFALIATGFVVPVAVIAAIGIWMGAMPVQYLGFCLAAGLIAGICAWRGVSFWRIVTYVGDQGWAAFLCYGDRSWIWSSEVLRFERAAELRSPVTDVYLNGVYQSTTHQFQWSDAAGNTLCQIVGSQVEYDAPIAPESEIAFGMSAEQAWNSYLLPRILQQIKQAGFAQFNLTGGECVRLGTGYIDFHLGGAPERLLAKDLASFRIDRGFLILKRHGAVHGWFANEGIFQFPYGKLANPQLFLSLFRKYMTPAPRPAEQKTYDDDAPIRLDD